MTYSYRTPIAADYVTALGRALYNFAALEGGIVSLARRLQLGFWYTALKLTAGQIADRFKGFAEALPVSDQDRDDAIKLADDFVALVKIRNRLMHGMTHTAADGSQGLFYRLDNRDISWTVESIHEAAQAFEEASGRANAMLYNPRFQARPW